MSVHIYNNDTFAGSNYTIESAEAELISKSGGTLKKNTQLLHSIPYICHGINNLSPQDIAVDTSIQLQREKDMALPHRRELAIQVRDTIASELQNVFRGDIENADVILLIRILLGEFIFYFTIPSGHEFIMALDILSNHTINSHVLSCSI